MTDKDAKRKKLSRRDFLKGGALAGAGIVLGRCLIGGGDKVPGSLAQEVTPTHAAYLPYISKPTLTPTPTPTATPTATPTFEPGTGPKVVHVRDADATSWSGSGWYGDYVNQSVVDDMVEEGLKALTGTSSVRNAWAQIIPGYTSGQAIAIKINLNNSGHCTGGDNQIDALPQPIKALVKTLVDGYDVAQSDIWVYDATNGGRRMSNRLRDPITQTFPSVLFFGDASCSGVNAAAFSCADDSLRVTFPRWNLNARWLPDLLGAATYLINMPILKGHSIAGTSLGFKNHFGTINRVIQGDNLHDYIRTTGGTYDPYYSPMVYIFNNTNIRDKTVLTLGDGLFGATQATGDAKVSWPNTFGDAPNSLFLSTDPVAIDCVMLDLLRAEWSLYYLTDATYDFLFVAESAGLGECEGTRSNPGGDPWQQPYGSGYQHLQYARIDL